MNFESATLTVYEDGTVHVSTRRPPLIPPTVSVPDPDDPFGVPLYEGPTTEAAKYLSPGTYIVDVT